MIYENQLSLAPLNVSLVPVQLFFAAAFLGLFGWLQLVKKPLLSYKGLLFSLYFTGMMVIRVAGDFWRGDHVESEAVFVLGDQFITNYQLIGILLMCAGLLGVAISLIVGRVVVRGEVHRGDN